MRPAIFSAYLGIFKKHDFIYLADAKPDACRYPLDGLPGRPRCCGHQVYGKVYCIEHYRACFQCKEVLA